MKENKIIAISALTIARQMIGVVRNKKICVINLDSEVDYLEEKHAQITKNTSIYNLSSIVEDIIYGYSLFSKGGNNSLLESLEENIKPNGIVLSIQSKGQFLTNEELGNIKYLFPNTVVAYCSFLSEKLKAIEDVLFLLFPKLKIWSKYQIIRIQQEAPELGSANLMNETNKKIFDEQYFANYYEPMIGSFSKQDLIRNKNWFYGWFEALEDWYDFKNGKNKKSLEIGCSIGAAADILYENGFDVCATDISSMAVENAKKLLPNINFQTLDIDGPQSESGKYDLIYAFEVIEHLDNPKHCIKNMHSLLAPGGSLICSTPYPYPYVYFDETHISVKFPLQWVEIFKQIGFRNVKFKQVGFVPFFYRYSKHFHFKLPFGVDSRYINSPVFIYGEK